MEKQPINERETTKTSETTNESAWPQSSELANQTANEKEATMTKATKLAGKTKDAERLQSAIRKSETEDLKRRTKNNKSKRREQGKVERDSKQLGTIEEEEIEPNRSEKKNRNRTEEGENLEGEQGAEQPKAKNPERGPNPEPMPRRGQRQRGKPNFFGQSVMITQIKKSNEKRREQSPEF